MPTATSYQRSSEAPTKLLTRIPVVDSPPKHYGILLDPDTGILSPRSNQKNRRTHVVLDFILELNKNLHPKYLICFDQSFLRCKQPSPDEQRRKRKNIFGKEVWIRFTTYPTRPFSLSHRNRFCTKLKKRSKKWVFPAEAKISGHSKTRNRLVRFGSSQMILSSGATRKLLARLM